MNVVRNNRLSSSGNFEQTPRYGSLLRTRLLGGLDMVF